MNPWFSLGTGALLGLSLAAPPGPMNAIMAEESLVRGRVAGMLAGLGAMSADGLFCLVAFAGAMGGLQRVAWVRGILFAIGGGLMLYFAWTILRELSGRFRVEPEETATTRGFVRTFVLALTNPYQISWWLTAGVGLVQPRSLHVMGYTLRTPGGGLTLAGFFAGIGLWVVGFPTLLVKGRQRLHRLVPWVVAVSALVLSGFAVLFWMQAVSILLV